MPRLRSLFFSTLCLFAATFTAHAQTATQPIPGVGDEFNAEDQNGAPVITTGLVASHGQVTPGQTVQLAWNFKLQPGWHIYWSNAGDSGLPPQLKAQGASEALPLIFPTPQVISTPPVTNYGYKDAVTFTTTYTIPQDTPQGPANLAFNAMFLYCKDICMPGKGTLTLPLNVAATSQPNSVYNPQQNLPQPLASQPLIQFNGNTQLAIKLPFAATKARFIPAEDGIIDDSAEQLVNQNLSGTYLIVSLDPQSTATPTNLNGLLLLDGQSYTIKAPIAGSASTPPFLTPATAAATHTPPAATTLAAALFLAFVAGVILNLMPCVLPVLSLKLLGLVRHHHGAQRTTQTLAYTFGVLISFWAFALAITLLQRGGTQLGWGFHLQNPLFVAGLTLLMLAIALNFFGVFEAGLTLTRLGSQPVREKHPLWQNFATGILAVIVATPCTVPFMGGAMAYALTQGVAANFAVFTALGLGLAFPFLLAIPCPAIFRWLPRPGAWMATFRHALGWPMLATALWLAYVFAAQAGILAAFSLLALALLLSLALWAYGTRPHIATLILVLAVGAAGLFGLHGMLTRPAMATWQPWSPQVVTEAVQANRPVFVDFTADWCVTCKVTEATVLNSHKVQTLFEKHNVLLLTGDWTSQNPAITEELARHNRKGVPLYLLYLPGNPQPHILPQLLTPGILEDALNGK